MDTFGSLMGIIFFVIIFIPILIINNRLNKKRKRLLAKLNSFAQEENKSIIEFDTWTDDSIIGISTDKEFIFFIRNKNDYNEKIKIPTNQIKDCYTNLKKASLKMTDSLEVVFELKEHKEKVVLQFFKADSKDFIMGEEMRIAKKWIDKVTDYLPKIKPLLYSV
ncbi:conserved hypothetical protein [Flavobacterium sp. 9AF]|uniref:hypothetical protein n=1 Tax=Flavobacterium sp. 9AF TaxID=2653142 RepID=UPI0012EF701E|nr:hypothetical protein [Flavobacterium sp. 9AF]VXB54763.1 conserved hypothetical protein [Flavobacterium sp. 9AF]